MRRDILTIKEKIKYLVIGVLVSFGIWFLYSTYNQIQINKKNIQSIGNFLTQGQTPAAPATKPASKPEEKKDGGNK